MAENQIEISGSNILKIQASSDLDQPEPFSFEENGTSRLEILEGLQIKENRLDQENGKYQSTELAALSEVVFETIDPSISREDWLNLVQKISQRVKPGGYCVLDTSLLEKALHSTGFNLQHQIWEENFAKLSQEGFSFYQNYKKFIALQKAPLNVLYIAPWVTFGGSDKGTVDWFRHLDKKKYRLFLITTQPSDNELLEEIEPFAEEIWNLPDLLLGNSMPQFIMEFIASRNIHLLHIMNSRLGFDMLPVFKSFFPHLRTVIQLHIEEEDRSGYCRYVTTRYNNLVDAYSVVSKHLKKNLLDYYISPAKITPIYLGVDAQIEFNPDFILPDSAFIAAHHLDQIGFHVLFPCRLVEQKDPLLMVDVAYELKKRGSKAVIHVVGDGDLRTKMEKRVVAKGLAGRVIFHGSSRQMPKWYKNTGKGSVLTGRY